MTALSDDCADPVTVTPLGGREEAVGAAPEAEEGAREAAGFGPEAAATAAAAALATILWTLAMLECSILGWKAGVLVGRTHWLHGFFFIRSRNLNLSLDVLKVLAVFRLKRS